MFTASSFLILLLSRWAYAACGTRSYETVFGGYSDVHEVHSMTFDVHKATKDLVVGGQAMRWADKVAYLYYVQESACSVQWAAFLKPFGEGVK